jgi:hypothetical protein
MNPVRIVDYTRPAHLGEGLVFRKPAGYTAPIMKKHRLARIVPVMLLAAVETVAHAHPNHEEAKPLGSDRILDRLTLEVGSIKATFDTAIVAQSIGDLGTVFKAEENLGVDRRDDMPRIELRYKHNYRTRVFLTVMDDERDGTREIDQELDIGGIIFPVNLLTESDVKLFQARAEWGYAFLRTPKFEAGAVAGLGLMDLEYSSFAEATINEEITEDLYYEDDLIVPHPLVGFYNEATPYPWMKIRWGARFLRVNYDDWEGDIRELDFAWITYPLPRLGIVLGYFSSRLEAEDSDDGFTTLDIEMDIDGFRYGVIIGLGKARASAP